MLAIITKMTLTQVRFESEISRKTSVNCHFFCLFRLVPGLPMREGV